ncbi:MAG: peptide deformylase [Gammaproteobacteria bacterium]|nr:peptide deformylase [Gammaproteobacteria bacterium]
MNQYKVLRWGDSRLITPSVEVEDPTGATMKKIIDIMWQVMKDYNGVGLAAPQIGINLRLMIFGLEKSDRYPDAEAVEPTVLINPGWEPLSDEIEPGWEGCLSIPDMNGIVPRYRQIRYWGLNERGEKIEREVSDFHARVFQHEYDHLDGILYPMRIEDLADFGFRTELEASGRFGRNEDIPEE